LAGWLGRLLVVGWFNPRGISCAVGLARLWVGAAGVPHRGAAHMEPRTACMRIDDSADVTALPLHSCRPPVIEQARELWPARHPALAERIEFVAGEFFDRCPPADM